MRDFTDEEKRIMFQCQKIMEDTTRVLRLEYPPLPCKVLHRTERLYVAARDTQEKLLKKIKKAK